MTTVTDLCFLTLHELADRIRARDLSALDATQAVLERIQRLNPRLNAYITVMEDEALAAARAADEEIAAGFAYSRAAIVGNRVKELWDFDSEISWHGFQVCASDLVHLRCIHRFDGNGIECGKLFVSIG